MTVDDYIVSIGDDHVRPREALGELLASLAGLGRIADKSQMPVTRLGRAGEDET